MSANAMERGRPIEILLVEDSPTDAGLTRHALASSQVPNHLHVVEDGESAIQYLRRQGILCQSCGRASGSTTFSHALLRKRNC